MRDRELKASELDQKCLDRLKRILDGIEPAPWQYEDDRIENMDGDRHSLWWASREDEFCVFARNSMSAMIEEIERLRAEAGEKADDSEPISEDWLRTVGDYDEERGTWRVDGVTLKRYDGDAWELTNDDDEIPRDDTIFETRGKLRAYLAFLEA